MTKAAVAVEIEDGLFGADLDKEEFLTFLLDSEEYGVDILRVQEIRGWESVTRVPNSPDYVRGVLNLRGEIIPIIDLRLRFNLSSAELTESTVVIVVTVEGELKNRNMGIVADSVSDVVRAHTSEVQKTPEYSEGVNTEYITGLAESDGKMIMLLDVEKLLNFDTSTEQVTDE